MKTKLQFGLLFLLTISAGCMSLLPGYSDKLATNNVFRDAVFGDTISHYSNLVVTEDDGTTKYYERSSDTLITPGLTLDKITYGFYKGRLSSVDIATKGYVDSRQALSVLSAKYGTPYQGNQFMETFNWFGKAVNLTYDENSITNDATILYSSVPMSAQEQADKNSDATHSSGKF